MKISTTCTLQESQHLHTKPAHEAIIKLLTDLLQAPNIAAVAKENVGSIDEAFFMVSSTYLDMVSMLSLQC